MAFLNMTQLLNKCNQGAELSVGTGVEWRSWSDEVRLYFRRVDAPCKDWFLFRAGGLRNGLIELVERKPPLLGIAKSCCDKMHIRK
jgi:hypothetical protein